MKKSKIITIIGAIGCLAGTLTHAAENSAEEDALVAAEVKKLFSVTSSATKVESQALSQVTDAAIYDVKVKVKGPESSSTSKVRVMKGSQGVKALPRPSTNQACPWLKELIKKDFKLKTEKDAEILEAALDTLYPISDGFGGKDKKAKAIRKQDGRIVFIRGEFFKDLKGFVFQTDESGAITEVNYSLKLKRE